MQIKTQSAQPVISRKGNLRRAMPTWLYRHLVESAFARLNHFRAMTFRYNKLKINYGSTVAMAMQRHLATDGKR